MQPVSIPAFRNTPFQCSRCRAQLEVAASDPSPILAISVALSIGFGFVLGLHGFALILILMGATAMFYWVGKLVQDFVATPRLEKSRSGAKPLRLAKRIQSSR
jgi:hypothetical protein